MIHYNRFGKKGSTTLLYIHGFLGGEHIYKDHTQLMKEDYDLITVDLAGHGMSKSIEVDPTIDSYLAQIEEVLKVEEVEKAVWIGHSMGGYIVLRALEKQIPSVEKAVLAYSTVNSDDASAKEKRDNQKNEIQTNGVEPFIRKILPAFFSNHANEAVIEEAIQIGSSASVSGLCTALDAMKARPNQQQTIDTTKTPVLIVEGLYDKVVAPIETMNPNISKVKTETGHLGMMELPEPFTTYIRQFLSQ